MKAPSVREEGSKPTEVWAGTVADAHALKGRSQLAATMEGKKSIQKKLHKPIAYILSF